MSISRLLSDQMSIASALERNSGRNFVNKFIILALISAYSTPAMSRICSADANVSFSHIRDSWYLVSGDVESGDCEEYGCKGHVIYEFTKEWPDGSVTYEESLDSFYISSGNNSVHISNRHTIVGNTSRVIDISVKKVSCMLP
jgi:hypothetical protein